MPAQPQPRFVLEPRGPFSLAAAARFWGGFTPAAHRSAGAHDHLHMAFPVEGTWTTAGICVQEIDGRIQGTVYGEADLETVREQTARILSLDVDGSAFADVGARDKVVADLQSRYPGLRPVCFYSAYEAAAWAILSSRLQMRQAAAVKARLAEAYGDAVEIHGEPERAFPSPRVLHTIEQFPGLYANKVARLHAVAVAALDGRLDAVHLRALGPVDALAELQEIPGIGPFSAELILLRGAGYPDYLTLVEPRFRRAVGAAYGFGSTPSDAELARISEQWKPYRTWVTFLLRQDAEKGIPADPVG